MMRISQVTRQLSSTLGLGLGVLGVATALFATIFAFADALVFHPIRLQALDRTVRLGGLSTPSIGDAIGYWRQARALERLALWETSLAAVSIPGEERQRLSETTLVSPEFFAILEGTPAIGRLPAADDFRGAAPVAVVISHVFWQEELGGRPSALGARLRISEIDAVVIGVMPPAFQYPAAAKLWMPGTPGVRRGLASLTRVDRDWIASLVPGVTIETAHHELQALLVRLNEVQTPLTGIRFGDAVAVEPLAVALARPFRSGMLALLAGGAIVLLLAWANVSTLFLSRTLERRQELAVRLSLGATRRRLLTSLSLRAAGVGVVSGLLGGLGAMWIFHVTRSLVAPLFPPLAAQARLPVEVIVISVIVAGVLGTLAGASPVLLAALWTDWDLLKQRLSTPAMRRGRRVRAVLAATQVAAAMVLLVGAGVSLRTFGRLTDVDLGFNPQHTLAVKLSVRESRSAAGTQAALDALLTATASTGVVSAAGVSNGVPLVDEQRFLSVQHDGEFVSSGYALVQGEYFRALGVQWLRGRDFTSTDVAPIIVNATLAARFWMDANPLGQLLRIEGEDSPRRVIGVVGDVRTGVAEDDGTPQFYLPFQQPYRGRTAVTTVTLVARCGSTCGSAERMLRDAIKREGGHPVFAKRLDEVFAQALEPARLRALVTSFYATFGLMLALAGIYGLMRFLAIARTHEMAVRMAVGADHVRIQRLIVIAGLEVCTFGIVVGACISVPLLQAARSLVYGIGPADPLTYVTAMGVLQLGTLLASLGPARRLARINPREALSA